MKANNPSSAQKAKTSIFGLLMTANYHLLPLMTSKLKISKNVALCITNENFIIYFVNHVDFSSP